MVSISTHRNKMLNIIITCIILAMNSTTVCCGGGISKQKKLLEEKSAAESSMAESNTVETTPEFNNPFILCLFSMDAFTPPYLRGYGTTFAAKEVLIILKTVRERYELIRKLNEIERIDEMIAYLTVYLTIDTKNDLAAAFKEMIDLSKSRDPDNFKGKFVIPGKKAIIFEIGHLSHSTKALIKLNENKKIPHDFIFRIYNSGSGITEYHPSIVHAKGRRTKFSPYLTFFAKETDLTPEFANLILEITIPATSKTFFKDKVSRSYDLYINVLSSIFLENTDEKYKLFISAQKFGSCTVFSWHSLFTHLFGNKTYKKLRLMITMGTLKIQLNSPSFNFLRQDFSYYRDLTHDFHTTDYVKKTGNYNDITYIFSYLTNTSFDINSPKRISKRDVILAYSNIIRWCHRQIEQLFKKKYKKPGNEPISKEYWIFRNEMEVIKSLYKKKAEEHKQPKKPNLVVFDFIPLNIVNQKRNDYGETKEMGEIATKEYLERKNEYDMGSYLIDALKDVDDFVKTCNSLVDLDKFAGNWFKKNILHFSAYILNLSEQINMANKNWKFRPDYIEKLVDILSAIEKLAIYASSVLPLNKLAEDEDPPYFFESVTAYSSLLSTYFNIWKYYYTAKNYSSTANNRESVEKMLQAFEEMLKNIIAVPRSQNIDVSGKERSENADAYCFYSDVQGDYPETRIELKNILKPENYNDKFIDELFLALIRAANNEKNLKIRLESTTNKELKEAIITALILSTDLHTKTVNNNSIGQHFRIDTYYYKLLNLIELFNRQTVTATQFLITDKIKRIAIQIYTSPVIKSKLYSKNYMNTLLNTQELADVKKALLEEESGTQASGQPKVNCAVLFSSLALSNPRILATNEGVYLLYKLILDRNSDLYRSPPAYNNVIGAFTNIFGICTNTINDPNEKELRLRIMAQCFFAIQRMELHRKEAGIVPEPSENLVFCAGYFNNIIANINSTFNELAVVFPFLDAVNQELFATSRSAALENTEMFVYGLILTHTAVVERCLCVNEIFVFIAKFYSRHSAKLEHVKTNVANMMFPGGNSISYYQHKNNEVLDSLKDCQVSLSCSNNENDEIVCQKIVYKKLTLVVTKTDVFYLYNNSLLLCFQQPISSNIDDVSLCDSLGATEKIFFVELPANPTRFLRYIAVFKNGEIYGEIYKNRNNLRDLYFELQKPEMFRMKRNTPCTFIIGISTLKDRVLKHPEGEFAVKDLPCLENFAQGTEIPTLKSTANDEMFYFLPIYDDCFVHSYVSKDAKREYDFYINGERFVLLDAESNKKYFENNVPVVFLRRGTGVVYLGCPINLIQDKESSKNLTDAKILLIECNDSFNPKIRTNLERAVMFRIFLECKMYLDAYEQLLHITPFTFQNDVRALEFNILMRAISTSKHTDSDAYFLKAATAYLSQLRYLSKSEAIPMSTLNSTVYKALEFTQNLLPGYLQCLSRSLIIDFRDTKLCRAFLLLNKMIKFYKNKKTTIYKSKIREEMCGKYIEMLSEKNDGKSPMSEELLKFVKNSRDTVRSKTVPKYFFSCKHSKKT